MHTLHTAYLIMQVNGRGTEEGEMGEAGVGMGEELEVGFKRLMVRGKEEGDGRFGGGGVSRKGIY
jgi:hypothetical protein